MYKLNGHGLDRGRWFLPESQPMTLSERDSSCTIQVGPEAPEIGFDDWLLDDEWPEGNIVWRVKGICGDDLNETRTIDLEHVIKVLEDRSLFNEVTPKTITGSSSATTCTARQAAEYILGRQNDWVLGDFEYSVSNPYEFDGDALYDALETVTDSLEYAVWEYDMSVYPFRLHVRHRSSDAECEMRGGRNLSTVKRSMSRSGMFTRIYPVGKNNLHINGEYLSRNEGLYGRKDKIETDQSKSTKANLEAWAAGRLRNHCEPTVTITISGLELSEETGESLDRLRMNRVCRAPLPEYGTTILERIVRLQWKDRIKDRESVTVTLANNVMDVTTIVKQMAKSGGKAAKGSAKQNFIFEANGEHLMYEVFDDCGHLHAVLRMTEESLRVAFDNTIACTRSEFYMTSESLRIQFENEISSTRSEFQMTSESLRISFESDIGSARSEFQMSAQSLRLYVASAEAAAEIAARINESTGESEIVIDAQKVYIGNQKSTTVIAGKCQLSDVTAEVIGARIATLSTVNVIALSASGNIRGSAVLADYIYVGNASDGYVNISNPLMELQLTGPTNNVYKLQKKSASDSSWQDVGTFSRAVASWTMGWSNGKFSVKANPQNQSCNTQIVQGSTTWNGNVATVPVEAIDSNSPNIQYATGRNISIDATSIYRAGSSAVGWSTDWANALPYTSGNNNTLTVATTGRVNSSGASANHSGSWAIYVTSGNNVAYARLGGTSGQIIAQVTHNKYNSGYNANDTAYATVDSASISPGGSTTVRVYYKQVDGTVVNTNRTYTVSASKESASNVLLGSYSESTSAPSNATHLSSWKATVKAAVEDKQILRFKATIDGGTGEKWYYISFK